MIQHFSRQKKFRKTIRPRAPEKNIGTEKNRSILELSISAWKEFFELSNYYVDQHKTGPSHFLDGVMLSSINKNYLGINFWVRKHLNWKLNWAVRGYFYALQPPLSSYEFQKAQKQISVTLDADVVAEVRVAVLHFAQQHKQK